MAMTVILEPRPNVEKDDKLGRHNFDRAKGFNRYEKNKQSETHRRIKAVRSVGVYLRRYLSYYSICIDKYVSLESTPVFDKTRGKI